MRIEEMDKAITEHVMKKTILSEQRDTDPRQSAKRLMRAEDHIKKAVEVIESTDIPKNYSMQFRKLRRRVVSTQQEIAALISGMMRDSYPAEETPDE